MCRYGAGVGSLTVTSPNALPNKVDVANVQWTWTYSTNGTTYQSLGTSAHKVYVALQPPDGVSDKVYEYLYRFSCVWAKGATSEVGVFDLDVGSPAGTDIWAGIATLNVVSERSDALNYYGSDATQVMNTWGLLVAQDGQCLSWALFLHDLAAAHGVGVGVVRLEPIAPRIGFRVGSDSGAQLDGQGEGMPQTYEFIRHIVDPRPDDGDPSVPDDFRGDIHDPSYGTQVSVTATTPQAALEEAVRLYEVGGIYQFLHSPGGWIDDRPERELAPGTL